MIDYTVPPEYCPDALATDVGWVNPKNGELLISVKNLRQKIEEKEKAKEFSASRNVVEHLTKSIIESKIEVDSPRNLVLNISDEVKSKDFFPAESVEQPVKTRKKRATKENKDEQV